MTLFTNPGLAMASLGADQGHEFVKLKELLGGDEFEGIAQSFQLITMRRRSIECFRVLLSIQIQPPPTFFKSELDCPKP